MIENRVRELNEYDKINLNENEKMWWMMEFSKNSNHDFDNAVESNENQNLLDNDNNDDG